MLTTSQWDNIREDLSSSDAGKLRRAVVAVGKIKAESIPDDISNAVVQLFRYPDPDIKAEAVRAIGLHWRLPSAIQDIAGLVSANEDWRVQLCAIDSLGTIGYEDPDTRCVAGKVLASAVLNEDLADNERMVAYVELLHIEGRIDRAQYRARDQKLPNSFPEMDIDRPWVSEIANRDCAA